MGRNGEKFVTQLEEHIDLSGSIELTDKDRDLPRAGRWPGAETLVGTDECDQELCQKVRVGAGVQRVSEQLRLF